MAAKVNYSDNLFYLNSATRLLRSALQLELDADYFGDKVVEDLFFIDRTLLRIGEALMTNVYLINRHEHVKELIRAKRSFADLLGELIDDKLPMSQAFDQYRSKLFGCRDEHIAGIADLQSTLEARVRSTEPEQVLSEDEYRFLLQNDAEPDA